MSEKEKFIDVSNAFVRYSEACNELKEASMKYICYMVDKYGKFDISDAENKSFINYDGGFLGKSMANPSSQVLLVYRELLNKGTSLETSEICIDIEDAKCCLLKDCYAEEVCAIASSIKDVSETDYEITDSK